MTFWSHLQFVFITGVVSILVGCRAASLPGDPGNRPLRVGINDSPPYSFFGKDGKPGGFSLEVIGEAARRKNIRLEVLTFHEGPDRPLAQGTVDVWPLVTDLPERHGKIFFSDPWMRTKYALLTRQGSPVRDRAGAVGNRISHGDSALNERLAKALFPRSKLVSDREGSDVTSLCEGRSDAALMESKDMLALLLRRAPPCRNEKFDVIPLSGAAYVMAIGANEAGREQAKALRSAIGDMAQDLTLDRLCKLWLHDTSDETAVVNEVLDVRRRDTLLKWASGFLTIAMGLLVGLIYRQRAAQRAIRRATDFASAALDTTGGLVLITDRQGGIVRFNRACQAVTGITFEEVQGKTPWDLFVPPDEAEPVRQLYRKLGEGLKLACDEHHWNTIHGARLYSWSHSVIPGAGGRVEYIVNAGIDISHREAAEKMLILEATCDPLTNLLNRRGLNRELEGAIARARSGERLRLGLADLDWFKDINDRFGHAAGDEVLVCFADLLRDAIGPAGFAARMGGDEFCFLLSGAEAFSEARTRQKLYDKEFRAPDGRTFRVEVSFGIADWEDSMRGASDWFQAADLALYAAKSSAKSGRLQVA